MVQTAEGALNEVHDMLQRINELAVKGENGTLTSSDRSYINSEVKQLMSEIDRVASTTTFNEKNLLTGSCSNVDLQVGAEASQHITLQITAMNCSGLGLSGSVTSASASGALNTSCKDAIAALNKQRSDLGSVQNRLEHTINNLNNIVENTTSAESSIRDTDMATEMVRYANNNILAQAGQAMLAQANQANQGVLSLLG